MKLKQELLNKNRKIISKRIDKNRKIISKRIDFLNKDIRKLISNAESYIKTLDPKTELIFEEVSKREWRCEQCGSTDIHDVSMDSDSEDNATDCGFECEEGHWNFVRKEWN